LYYLLTGENPFVVDRTPPMQLYERLKDQAMQPPSKKVNDRRLEDDLDNIVCKALEFEPGERYPSVDALAEDVKAHLTSRPISARPHTLSYRTRKFIRRNRVAVIASAAVLLALILGMGVALWQARIAKANYERAERRFQDVRQLARIFIFDMDDAIARLPGSTSVRATIVRSSLQYLDGLAQEAKDDPTLQEELANAYEKVGDVQGRPGALNLGGTAAALQSYRKAEGIRRALLAITQNKAERDNREEALANTLMRISSILRATGDIEQAFETDKAALTIRKSLLERNPGSMLRLRNVASSLTATSTSLSLLGGFQGVLELRREGLTMYEQLAKANPSSEEDQAGLALAHTRMASILLHENDHAGAVQHYGATLEIQKRLSAMHPNQTQYEIALALAYSNVGNALRVSGDSRKALVSLSEARRIYERLANADPNEVRARTLLATVRLREAIVWSDLGDQTKAAQILRGVLEERRWLAERNPANAGARGEVAETYAALGDVALRTKNASLAVERYQKALDIFNELRQEGRFSAANKEEVGRIEAQLAEASKRAAGGNQRHP
jgi:non-specific serine/threonine protein kinase/serine/threonine-protein kinase